MKLVILAGGSGTRLWPLSRKLYPKQFIPLFEGKSLFQQTLKRNKKDDVTLVTSEEQYFMVVDQANEENCPKLTFILEPVGRNTAPAIALACLSSQPDDIILVTPSDHIIKNIEEYQKCLKKAEEFAKKGYLVNFGIKPTHPATGYGYIQADGNNVVNFKEKPNKETAKKYLDSGNYYWNSGMFVFKSSVFLKELETHSPDIYKYSQIAYNNCNKNIKGTFRIKKEDMDAIPSDSIDYAVMEKSKNRKVVFSDIGWSDLGSFDELADYFSENEYKEDIAIESSNNFVISPNNKIVCTNNIKDLVIIDTPDALMISQKGKTQKIKDIVASLQKINSSLVNEHITVYRPWGKYTVLLEKKNAFKIKEIEVSPQRKLSFQKHEHRNEHWVVVKGQAKIYKDKEVLLLSENESTYIPKGVKHRLENTGNTPLVIIEAQVGSYVEEDDIIRYEDDYNRA
jgi:mannose-1-phosphate guanylyltransferase